MHSKILAAIFFTITGIASIHAEESPYRGLENREIKALSKQQITGYLNGKGMGLALPGELNDYPGPKHVLELASNLELSPAQRTEVEGIFETMQKKAIVLGKQIIDAEASLDTAFSDGLIDSEFLEMHTEQIGLLNGKLRTIHLKAHLETKALLTYEQVQRYIEHRGYDHADHSTMKHYRHDH